MKFVKMHGIGNDYVYFDAVTTPGVEKRFAAKVASASPAGKALIQRISDRHRGVGSDGVILVCRPTAAGVKAGADVRMRMFNADGSQGEMCGNGVRCVAKFAHDRLGVRTTPMRIETGRGVLSIEYRASKGRLVAATVDMGAPILDLRRIPVLKRKLAFEGAPHHWGIVDDEKQLGLVGTFVSMGNPHVVIFENGSKDYNRRSLADVDLQRLGPLIERHAAFPNRINVHFAAPIGRSKVVMRTWERGAGVTQACGTGACAVLVAGVLTKRLSRRASVTLPGGDLRVRWDNTSKHVFMTGPAADVFDGEWLE